MQDHQFLTIYGLPTALLPVTLATVHLFLVTALAAALVTLGVLLRTTLLLAAVTPGSLRHPVALTLVGIMPRQPRRLSFNDAHLKIKLA